MADSDTICPALRTEASISKWIRLEAYEIDDPDPPNLFPSTHLPQGAYHGGDAPLLFPQMPVGAPGTAPPPQTANQRALSAQMTAEWTAFARNGDPSAAGTPLWPPFRSGRTVMSLQAAGDSQLTTVAPLAALHHCALWDRLASQGA